MVTTSVFAYDDFRALTIDFTIYRPDGSEIKIASGALFYDREAQYTDVIKSYPEVEKVTVSVRMPDGSTRTAGIPKGEVFTWDFDNAYALYADKDGKMLLGEKSQPIQTDLTLYCLPK
ncbi:MAG: hypothetical protein RRY79_06160 [Clostridia bacterium]